MKKIRKIIISFGIILMGFGKKVLASVPINKGLDMPQPEYGVPMPTFKTYVASMISLHFGEFLTLFFVPIVFIIGLISKVTFEKRIEKENSNELKIERKKVKNVYAIFVFILFTIFIIILCMHIANRLSESPGQRWDADKLSYRMEKMPGYYFTSITSLGIILAMTYNKKIDSKTKKIMYRISIFAVAITFVMIYKIVSFIGTLNIVDGCIVVLENILLSKQIYQYKIKLINEKTKDSKEE